MSSYLSIYIKPKEKEEKIHLYTYSRSSDVYEFFVENNLTCYCYKNMEDKEEQFRKLDIEQFDYAVNKLTEEILEDERRLHLMKELSNREDSTINDILEWSQYVEEKRELKIILIQLRSLIGEYSFNDVEAIYTNYD